MFTVIWPSSRDQKEDLLSQIVQTRESFLPNKSERDSFDRPDTLYVAYERPDLGVLGSARLNLLHHSPGASFYQKRYSQNQLRKAREVSLVSFEMERGHWAQESPEIFDNVIQNFYRGLYEVLINIAVAQDLDKIVSLSLEEDHQDLTFFGSWPFEKTHLLKIESCPFVMGELPMTSYHCRVPLEEAAA